MVDFEFAFSAPHRLTLCRPSASEKILADVSPEGIRFSRSFGDLTDFYPLSWKTPAIDIQLFLNLSTSNSGAVLTKWYRHKSGIPYLIAEGELEGAEVLISAISGKTGVIIKTEIKNSTAAEYEFFAEMSHLNGWVISNKGWIDGVNSNVLLTGNDGRADRFLCYAAGAESYPLFGMGESANHSAEAPMANESAGIRKDSMKKITAKYTLKPGDTGVGYFILPHEKYFEDIEELKNTDFEKEISKAVCEWQELLKKGAALQIDDPELMHCYNACVSDLFVMREKMGNRTGIVCGTEKYRSANSGEPLETEILLDTLGYTELAEEDYRMYLEAQEKDGNWQTTKGWEHESWGMCYNKANAVMTHYELTGNRDFLEKYYKNMYASSVFNYNSRQGTKNAEKKHERGLMPRGMGDCGMMDGNDFYGVFYPPNCLAVAADGLTLKAAKILGKTEDIKLLEKIYGEAREDLLTSMRENLAEKDGMRIIPGIAQRAVGCSSYGCLYSFFPGDLIGADEPMLADTVKYLESKKISEGGLPIGMGWRENGLWAAMALSNLSRAYLRMGRYGLAGKYLYPVLNHASPFVTWCEERDPERNTKTVAGDMQHLWTPLAVVQYITEAICFENNSEIHILAGILPQWLEDGRSLTLTGFCTSFGKTDIAAESIDGEYRFKMKTERPIGKTVVLHLPYCEPRRLDTEGKREIIITERRGK